MIMTENLPLRINAPISLGELIDKITILEIKKEYLKGNKLINIDRELKSLNLIIKDNKLKIDKNLISLLKDINKTLWDIENRIREKEKEKDFGKPFIELARSVYKSNDIRASIKQEINYKYNSNIIEEKSYSN
tara:strand:+ start:1895 stop:2293 length:399 start_codon:yes stop_codon:yes gene_type:complete